VKYVINM